MKLSDLLRFLFNKMRPRPSRDAAYESFIRAGLKKEKEYLDHVLDGYDPDIRLDEDQRRAVLSDDGHCLVVAGAGAGKTTTVAAKVKYLVDRKGVRPEQLLVISFTNKAVDELRQRINGDLGIACPVTTFHAAGYALVRQQAPGKIRIADEDRLRIAVRDGLREAAAADGTLVQRLRRAGFSKPVSLICRFIVIFKTNGAAEADLDKMLRSTQEERSRLFLSLVRHCFRKYEKYLREHHLLDFEDMINESARLLREGREGRPVPEYRYIIVDEYQDISRQRFDLISALKDVSHARIIAVGDDWQSVFAFSGADVSLFTDFAKKTGQARLLKIERTYRNSQELIRIAGRFVLKNGLQIRKKLVSGKHLARPVVVLTYDRRRTAEGPGAGKADTDALELAEAIAAENALRMIRRDDRRRKRRRKRPAETKVLMIGRFGFDIRPLTRSGRFEADASGSRVRSLRYPDMNITFLTAHSSKGLGFDHVILLNGRDGIYGFPAKIPDDPVLSFVIKKDPGIAHAEERRLFYVAMTRTKNRVYIIAPAKNPSEFVKELMRENRSVKVRRSRG